MATAVRSFASGGRLRLVRRRLGKCRDADRQRLAGPVSQGSIRFGEYSGGGVEARGSPMWSSEPSPTLDYNSSTNVIAGGTTVTQSSQVNFNYAQYSKVLQLGPATIGVFGADWCGRAY